MTFTPEVWDGALRRLRRELPSFTCDAWLENLTAEVGRDDIRLLCPTSFHRERVRDHYLAQIRECIRAEAGREMRVELISSGALLDGRSETGARAGTREGKREATREESATPTEALEGPFQPGPPRSRSVPRRRASKHAAAPVSSPRRAAAALATTRAARGSAPTGSLPHAQHTFQSFIVGDCNALAREASLAVLRETGPGLSQLYLCSEPGLGKTHLARAVSAEARATGRRAVYTSAEAFTNEFLASLRSHQMNRFKQKYRSECDVLIVEDVHFLQGKQSTQLEFFHTVQHVLDAGGRVVLTGNRLPRALSELESRVRSQVAGGFLAELGPPDAQVRGNILRQKASAGGVHLPEDCLAMLVESIRGSVRDLESVLIQLVTTASLLKKKIDAALTREALEKKGAETCSAVPRLEPAAVIGAVARWFKTTPDAMATKSRRRDVLVPRQLAMYLCRRYTDASLADIGRTLGRDHPSVRNAISKVERAILERAPMRYQVEALVQKLDELMAHQGSGA
jgi:chromosomal replication initiator protein